MFYPEDAKVFDLPEVKDAWRKSQDAAEAYTKAYAAYVAILEEASE